MRNTVSVDIVHRMKLSRILSLAAILVACGEDATSPTDVGHGPFGGTPLSDAEFAAAPKTLPRAVVAPRSELASTSSTLPSSVLLTNLPESLPQGTATTKGSPGSCEVWAAGYVVGSYVANLANGGGPLDASNTLSVGFVYALALNEEGASCPKGTSPTETLDYLVKVGARGKGAPTRAQQAYEPNCAFINAINLERSFETELAIGGWSALSRSPDTATDQIKEQLAAGLPAQMTLELPYGFLDYENGTFELSDECPSGTLKPACAISSTGGFACVADSGTNSGCSQHGIAVVGYDDTISAFWIQNSFGADWGEEGRMWLAYDAFEQVYLGGTTAVALARVSEATIAAHQAVDPREGREATTHLVLRTSLPDPIRVDTITIETPEGTAFSQGLGHWFRTGVLYASRHDALAWPDGSYEISIAGKDADGVDVVTEVTANLEALPSREEGPPAAGDVTGTNELPVAF